MSYATGSSVRLVRTNSLTSVKDLIKSFAAENKKKTVQTGMKSYFSAVTKAVGEVTGLTVSNSTTPTSITPSSPTTYLHPVPHHPHHPEVSPTSALQQQETERYFMI